MDDSSSRPDAKSVSKKPAAPGVRTPFAGESSGSNVPVPPQDEATLVDAGPSRHDPDATIVDAGPRLDPEATLVDADATIAPGTSFPRRPTPAKRSSTPHPLPQDETTLVDALPKASDPDATLVDADATIAPGTPYRRTPTPPRSRISGLSASAAVFEIGDVLGGRYEILQLLGEGGMGAVYKATDRELDRFVALKVIRPELASNPSILARFKQELLLAHQVTHRNVIRIYDLGEAEGVKFITMEFIEGRDLRSIIREKNKFAPEEAVEVIQQVCQALDAAHSVGVIHRDLKPQNIMQDGTGRMLVMDFGLARTLEGDGMTQTGAIVGTMEYMSPEQSLGKDLDQRSDIFALGLILYEMLTGKQPFAAESALASLIKRTQERATPVSDVDAQIPGALSGIVSKCLERDLDQRYQSVSVILADLNTWKDKRAAGTIKFDAAVKPLGRAVPWPLITGIATVLVLAVTGFLFRDKLFKPTPARAPSAVSVLVSDFTNHTGDPVFDGTLEPMFNVALEGASFINAYNRGAARDLAKQLPHPSDKLDEESARLIGVSQGLAAVVTGSLSLRGDAYKLSVEALDARTGNSIASAEINAPTKDKLLLDIPKLAAPIRKALGDTTPVAAQIAVSGPFTAASLEVVHLYSIAMQQQFAGKTAEAFQSFSKAAELDPNFARAYSGMAATANDLGRQADGEKYIKLAMEHLDRMTERERYRMRGFFYLILGNYPKCVEEFNTLVGQYPADRVGQSDLAWCYAYLRNFPKAVESARKAVEIAPKGALEHVNLAFFSSFSGDFKTGEREARTALEISPGEVAQINLGEAQLGQGKVSEAAETYHGQEKFGSRGASMGTTALADLALYQGRFSEEARLLEHGASADLQAKTPEDAANKFAALAYAELLRGQSKAAVASAEKALANGQTLQVRFLAGRVFAEAGETAQAKKMADSLARETQVEPQAYSKIIEGKLALQQGDSPLAIKAISDANNLLDTWIGRFELGRAYLQAGQFVEADSEFDRCIKRRGEALELLMDNAPTYGYLPYVYYYQGRVRQGLKTPAFADSYRSYLSIRGQSTEDPLVAEVRRSLGQ
jgi:tetratricopeptide (TPR) repeat protein/predicted Ser/Thr protein kinase